MSKQLDLFKDYIGKLKRLVGDRTNFILANSVVVVVLGSNDISNTYFLSRLRQSQYDFPTYADLLVNSASNFYKVFLLSLILAYDWFLLQPFLGSVYQKIVDSRKSSKISC